MLEYLKEQHPDIYSEVITQNCYGVNEENTKGKVVFDLGANRGFFSLLCNELGAKEIIAVEAQRGMYDGLLTKNTSHLNNLTRIYRAVTDKSGDFVTLSDDDGGSSLYINKDKKGVGAEVETISFVDLVGNRPETDMVLKMDIEGAEYEIFTNTPDEIIKKFKHIGIEIHGHIRPQYKGTAVVENKLFALGYDRVKTADMYNIFPNADGTKTYVPMGTKTAVFVRRDELKEPYIIISPFSQKMRNGKVNPKSYPYWNSLLSLIKDKHIIQIGVEGEQKLTEDVRFNLPIKEIERLVKGCDYWISVDTFLQHLAQRVGKKGVVIFGPSDPNIFGYPNNVNILKNRSVLRKAQFDIWESETFDPSRFLNAEEVYEIIKQNFTG